MEINEHVEPDVDPLGSSSGNSGNSIPNTRDHEQRNSPVADSYPYSSKIRFSVVREILKSKRISETLMTGLNILRMILKIWSLVI